MTRQRLKEYRARERELKGIEEVMRRLRSRIESPGMQVLSGMPHGGSGIGDRVAENIAKLHELMDRYNQLWDELIALQQEVEAAIGRLEDPVERTLMRLRYMEGLRWERICVEIGYEWRQVHYIHARVLKKICAEAG